MRLVRNAGAMQSGDDSPHHHEQIVVGFVTHADGTHESVGVTRRELEGLDVMMQPPPIGRAQIVVRFHASGTDVVTVVRGNAQGLLLSTEAHQLAAQWREGISAVALVDALVLGAQGGPDTLQMLVDAAIRDHVQHALRAADVVVRMCVAHRLDGHALPPHVHAWYEAWMWTKVYDLRANGRLVQAWDRYEQAFLWYARQSETLHP